MPEVQLLLKEYINYSGRTSAGLLTGATKKMTQNRFKKTGSMKGTGFQIPSQNHIGRIQSVTVFVVYMFGTL